MTRSVLLSCLLSAALGVAAAPSPAEDCVDFKWDVAQERALFAGTAAPLTAGADAKSAPLLRLQHLYDLKLLPQEQVAFPVTPGRKSPRSDSYAGIVSFKIPAAGSYRVSIDMAFWIDV